jgi:hypothetical protein
MTTIDDLMRAVDAAASETNAAVNTTNAKGQKGPDRTESLENVDRDERHDLEFREMWRIYVENNNDAGRNDAEYDDGIEWPDGVLDDEPNYAQA